MRLLGEAEGERFELSSDLTARNGFRDFHTCAYLQAFIVLVPQFVRHLRTRCKPATDASGAAAPKPAKSGSDRRENCQDSLNVVRRSLDLELGKEAGDVFLDGDPIDAQPLSDPVI
jgi:hypothetical protein